MREEVSDKVTKDIIEATEIGVVFEVTYQEHQELESVSYMMVGSCRQSNNSVVSCMRLCFILTVESTPSLSWDSYFF